MKKKIYASPTVRTFKNPGMSVLTMSVTISEEKVDDSSDIGFAKGQVPQKGGSSLWDEEW